MADMVELLVSRIGSRPSTAIVAITCRLGDTAAMARQQPAPISHPLRPSIREPDTGPQDSTRTRATTATRILATVTHSNRRPTEEK